MSTPPQTSQRFDHDMRESAEPRPRSRHIPHAVFGIGSIVLLLLAALVLIALSGQLVHSPGAVMLVTAGIPLMIILTVIVAQRWRRARRGRL